MRLTTDMGRRRLRGVARNALVWGAGWFVAAMVMMTAMRAFGMLPAGVRWIDEVGMAIKFAIFGVLAGAVFSSVVRVVYRGWRLSEMHALRFGLLGAAVTAVFVPLFMQTMNLLSGDGLVAWSLVLDDVPFTAIFGGLAASGSLWLAQRAGGGRESGGGPAPGAVDGEPLLAPAGELPALDRGASIAHQRREQGQIVQRDESRPQRFVSGEQVP
jgi:hypothetical protein